MKSQHQLLHLCLTDACQLKCKHCYFGDFKKYKELSLDDIYTVLDKFNFLHNMFVNNGYVHDYKILNLSGGEPLLHSKILDIIHIMSKSFNSVKFLSNGINYSSDVIEHLCSYTNDFIYQISLDGMKEAHDFIRGNNTFDKSVETIRKIKKDFGNKCFLQISFNVNDINYKDVLELTKFVKSLNVDRIFFDRYVPYWFSGLNVLSKREYSEYIESIKLSNKLYNDDKFNVYMNRSMQPDCNYLCNASIGNQICTTNGDRFACTRYQVKTGNWFEDSIKDLYEKSIYWYNKLLETPKECKQCSMVDRCNGGMRCLSYAVHKKYDIKDINCLYA